MATYSEVTVKFTNDWVEGDSISFVSSAYTVSRFFTWVATRSGANQVTTGTPTANPGETAAINFKAAFDLDFTTGYVTTLQNTNEVLIQTETEDEFFYAMNPNEANTGTATVTYNNTEEGGKINVRSPYFTIDTDGTRLTKVDMDIYIYTGNSSDTMDGVTYSLSNTEINNEVKFEISHLISDYLDINFSGDYDSRVVWVNVERQRYINDAPTAPIFSRFLAFDGYGYFEEGVNPTLSERLLQSNSKMYVLDNNYFYIPIQQDYLSQVDLKANGSIVDTQTFTPTTDSDDVIRYIGFTNESVCGGVVNYLFEDDSDYLFEDGSVFVFSAVATVDEILITYSDASTESVYVETITENKHTPYRLTFINKFGALQSVWMFKRSDLSMEIERDQYRAYTFNNSTNTYDTAEHQYKNMYVSGKQSLRLNSGFYPESHNEVFRQLLLSEKVWIHYESELLPVNVKSNNISYKTSVNDKLINYTIDFDFAFDKINSIY